MYEVKNCDLDLSVKWFQLLFRKIKLTVTVVDVNINGSNNYGDEY